MPHVDAHLFKKKGVKRELKLLFEDGDSILEGIKSGMREHGLDSVKIESMEGSVQEALINYFVGNSFKSSVVKDKKIMLSSGGFRLSYDELFGSMKIVTSEKPPLHGTLVRGKAKDGLTINLSFLELIDDRFSDETVHGDRQ